MKSLSLKLDNDIFEEAEEISTGLKITRNRYNNYIYENTIKIDISSLATGIYFVRVINDNGVTGKKLVKQ